MNPVDINMMYHNKKMPRGAGIIAISLGYVIVVEKSKGQRSFPKGKLEENETIIIS